MNNTHKHPDLGSVKQGTEHFWRQRLTAIANVPLILFFVFLLVSLHDASYKQIVHIVSQPLVTVTLILGLLSSLYHMYLGMHIIIEDYAHRESSKIFLIMLNIFFTVTVAVSSLFALLKLSLGG